jgi:hypothetical protein
LVEVVLLIIVTFDVLGFFLVLCATITIEVVRVIIRFGRVLLEALFYLILALILVLAVLN